MVCPTNFTMGPYKYDLSLQEHSNDSLRFRFTIQMRAKKDLIGNTTDNKPAIKITDNSVFSFT